MPWIATYPIASVTDLPPAPAFARLFPGFGGGAWRRAEGGLGASCLVVPSPLPRSMWETPARALVMRGKMSDLWQEHKAHVSITLSADGWEPKQKMMAGVWLGAIAEEWNLGAYRLEIRRDARLVVPFLTRLCPALATCAVEMEGVGETAWVSFRGLSEILGHDIAVPFQEKSEIAGIIDQVSRIASFFSETGTRCNVGQTVDGPAGTIWRVAESPWGRLRPRVWALVPARSV